MPFCTTSMSAARRLASARDRSGLADRMRAAIPARNPNPRLNVAAAPCLSLWAVIKVASMSMTTHPDNSLPATWRTPAWTGSSVRPEALQFVRRLAFDAPAAAFDAAFTSDRS